MLNDIKIQMKNSSVSIEGLKGNTRFAISRKDYSTEWESKTLKQDDIIEILREIYVKYDIMIK